MGTNCCYDIGADGDMHYFVSDDSCSEWCGSFAYNSAEFQCCQHSEVSGTGLLIGINDECNVGVCAGGLYNKNSMSCCSGTMGGPSTNEFIWDMSTTCPDMCGDTIHYDGLGCCSGQLY